LHEEEQHIDIREKLLNLPKVKAGDDFINALQRKINLADAETNQKKIPEVEKESIWVKLFGKKRNPWLIPSFSLTIVAVLVLTVYVLNTKRFSDFSVLTDNRKSENSTQFAPEIKKPAPDEKDKITSQDLASDFNKDNANLYKEFDGKTSTRSSDTYDGNIPSPTIAPKMELKQFEESKPSSSDPVKSESGKVDRKGDERIYQENGRTTETISPLEKEKKKEEVLEQKISDEKSVNIDETTSKGFIEKKDKKESKAMPKSKKPPVDSTKIDQKVLEKIKEEINKEK
jgi:hypothetical protein